MGLLAHRLLVGVGVCHLWSGMANLCEMLCVSAGNLITC